MKYKLIFLLLTVAFTYSYAQDKEDETIFDKIQKKNANVTINQEYRIKALVAKHVKINKKQDGFEGYRLRIFSASGSNGKKKAFEVKTEFMKSYPYTNSEVKYISPNFRVVVGDFRTKSEAEKFRIEIEKNYPNAFIVKDIIDFPKL